MKSFAVVLAAAALAAPLSVAPVRAKTLPPAFGTELVPEQASQEYKGPSAEIEERIEEEKEEKGERAVQRPARHRAGGSGRAGRVRIQLDGDEDGGGAVDGGF